MDITLIEKLNPSAEDIKLISKSLKEYNKSIIGEYNTYPYLLLLYKGQTFIGGSYSEIKLGWLYIDLLWVDAMYRRQGFGTKLLLRTEVLARKRGVLYAKLNTGNFQGALSFYHYHGYEIFAELEIFPENRKAKEIYMDYFMKKSLDPKKTVLNTLSLLVPSWPFIEVRKHLNDFLFRKNKEINAITSQL